MSQHLYLILLLPFAGFLINGLFGKRLGDRAVGIIGAGVIGATVAGCAASTQSLPLVSGFVVSRYAGRWYEIARLPNRFERGLIGVTANYSIRDDGAVIVLNKGFDPGLRKWRTAKGKAYFKGAKDQGLLKVTFFWPFYGEYRIIRLGKDYDYAVVTSSNCKFLWILSRSPVMKDDTLKELVEFVRQLGIDTPRLIYVDQSLNTEGQMESSTPSH